VHETWQTDFTLDPAAAGDRFYRVNDDAETALENGITLIGSGQVHIAWAKVDITPKTFHGRKTRRITPQPARGWLPM
jgi:hypothetical protein